LKEVYPSRRRTLDPTDAYSIQKQALLKLKSGTAKQLEANTRYIKTLLKHHVLTASVVDHLAAGQLASETLELRHAVHHPPLLIEWCCDPRSKLCEEGAKLGLWTVRFDGQQPRTTCGGSSAHHYALSLVRAARSKGRRIVFWISLPCRYWSVIQRLSKNKAALRQGRAESRRLQDATTRLIQEIGSDKVDYFFEWPRWCDGWSPAKNPSIVKMLKMLQSS
jgi:hypothetical protein